MKRAAMGPRFQCYRQASGWSWRLLGANNRMLARAATPGPSPAAAVADARAVQQLVAAHGPEAVRITWSGPVDWRWVLLDGDLPRAVSATGYPRRMECVRAAARFVALAPAIDLPDGDLPDGDLPSSGRITACRPQLT